MEKKRLFIYFFIILILTNLVCANRVGFTSKNNFENRVFQEYSYIEDERDLHSYIGIEIFINNFTEDLNKNLSLVVFPVNQMRHIGVGNIKIINVSFCEGGGIDRGDSQIHLKLCREDIKEITKDSNFWEINSSSSLGNYSKRRFLYRLTPKEIKEGEKYAFRIEYLIKDYAQSLGEGEYTFSEYDEFPENADKTIFLPRQALIKESPKDSLLIEYGEKRAISMGSASRSNDWYTFTYIILPWYKKSYWQIIISISSFLVGISITIIISLYIDKRSFKKQKKELEKIKNSINYQIRKINKQ